MEFQLFREEGYSNSGKSYVIRELVKLPTTRSVELSNTQQVITTKVGYDKRGVKNKKSITLEELTSEAKAKLKIEIKREESLIQSMEESERLYKEEQRQKEIKMQTNITPNLTYQDVKDGLEDLKIRVKSDIDSKCLDDFCGVILKGIGNYELLLLSCVIFGFDLEIQDLKEEYETVYIHADLKAFQIDLGRSGYVVIYNDKAFTINSSKDVDSIEYYDKPSNINIRL